MHNPTDYKEGSCCIISLHLKHKNSISVKSVIRVLFSEQVTYDSQFKIGSYKLTVTFCFVCRSSAYPESLYSGDCW